MIYEPCNWYKSIKHKSPLDNFIEERSIDAPSVYCNHNTQTMVVNYIQCARLEEIEKIEPWSPAREESVKKWATPDKLRRLKYHQEEETGKKIITHTAFHDMPILLREYKLDNNIQEKFKIGDGIHRINRARELCKMTNSCNTDCILASIEEHVKINKNDTKNIEVKQ
jgi:hypothetical protein